MPLLPRRSSNKCPWLAVIWTKLLCGVQMFACWSSNNWLQGEKFYHCYLNRLPSVLEVFFILVSRLCSQDNLFVSAQMLGISQTAIENLKLYARWDYVIWSITNLSHGNYFPFSSCPLVIEGSFEALVSFLCQKKKN